RPLRSSALGGIEATTVPSFFAASRTLSHSAAGLLPAAAASASAARKIRTVRFINFRLRLFLQSAGVLLQDIFLQLPARAGDRRKVLDPFERPAGVDQRARAEAFFRARDDRVERAAPAASHDVDRLLRIDARTDRPEHVVDVGNIDVVVDDDGVAAEIGAGLALA